jgi:tetratricopeptide (TPR) repeat protein
MYIKRDYSEPFFGRRRRRRFQISARALFVLGLIAGAGLLFVFVNAAQIETATLNLMGRAPTPTLLPRDLAAQSASLSLTGDLAGAAVLLEQIVRQEPENRGYLYQYGLLLIDMGDYDVAIQIGEQLIDLDLTDPRGYALQATALVYSDTPSGAIPVALSGLEADPGFGPLHAALARAYALTGRYNDALTEGILAVQLAPAEADSYRAYAFALQYNQDVPGATEQLEQAIAVDPDRIFAYFELAALYLAQDRDQEAILLYERILSIQPFNARAMLRMCLAYRKIGEFAQALGYCEDAVATNPADAEANFELGRMRYNDRDFAGALESFTACLESNPNSLECTYRQGLALYYLGDCDQSWAILRDSLEMANARAGTERAVEDIRNGLIAIGQTCPQYSGQAPPPPTPDPAGA